MRRLVVWAFWLSFLPFSGRGQTYTIHISRDFDAGERQAIEAAAAEWVGVVPVDFGIDGDVDGCDHVRAGQICFEKLDADTFDEFAPSAGPGLRVVAFTAGAHDLQGRTIDGGVVYTTDERIDSRFQAVMAHELGHAMGLEHTGDGTLMSPVIDRGSPVPTCADVRQWARLRALPVRCVPNK